MSLKVTPVILFDIYSRLHHELSHNSRTKWLSFFNYSDLLFVLPLRSLFAPPVYFKHESLRGIYGTDKWVTVKKPLLLFLPWGICDVCVIWYHLCHLKNLKNTLITLLHGCFARFSNCTNGTKLCEVSHIDAYFLHPAGNYMFKVNNRNIRTRCEICSKLTIKIPGIFIVNFEHVSHLVLQFLLLTLCR